MNFYLVILLLVVTLTAVAEGAPQLITTKRKFPGQRRRGATNYGQYSVGKKGYNKRRGITKNPYSTCRPLTMNFFKTLLLLLALMMTATLSTSFLVRQRRRFPGERRLGATNYGFHFFGRNGYENRRKVL
ncbi:hypothetical protein FHG87_012624 [Trinorchestia longiramus]|nr:hypothetical protein FHG87_012624 [Trinorchestia longiramus]